MKLRIVTSMLLVVFLSVCNSLTASAHDGCHSNGCGRAWHHHHHGCWGHHGYFYGPDGCYSHMKAACCDSKKEASCCATDHCHHTYSRANYYEDCCGRGHLHVVKNEKED